MYGEERNPQKLEAFERGFQCGVKTLYRMLYEGTITLIDIDLEKLHNRKS